MIKVNSRVKLSMPRIKKLTDAAVTALEKTAEAFHTEVVQALVIPRRDGALQGEKMFRDDSQSENGVVSIVHEGPYARRLYYHPEYNFHKEPWEEEYEDKEGIVHHKKHDGNPNARGEWYEDWLPGGSKADFAPETFRKLYKKEGEV